jgi:hypothetical protein
VLKRIVVMMIASAAVVACNDSVNEPVGSAEFVVQVVDEQFRVRVEDPAEITRARALIASGASTNINGQILRGTGGFNAGYSWHLKPSSVEFVDLTIELCDGMPSYVEENVDYYVDTVKQYCPWGIKVLGEVPAQQ